MKKLLLILACSVAFLEVAAQDMIIYKDKTIDEVTIIEVNPDFIKYREYGSPVNSATFSIEKDYLSKIIFESGRVMDLSKTMMDDERIYANQKRRALKIDLAGINSNYSFVTFEQAINPNKSWEAGIIWIGAGFDAESFDSFTYENAFGGALNFGYKLKRSPNFYMNRMRYGHILRGTYIKPNVFMNLYQYNLEDRMHVVDPATMEWPITRESAFALSAQIDFGNQLVFDNSFLVDYSFGLGYGFTSKLSPEQGFNPPAVNYGFIGGRRQVYDWQGQPKYSSPITFSFAIRIGFLMKND